jgi:hypothetical protein
MLILFSKILLIAIEISLLILQLSGLLQLGIVQHLVLCRKERVKLLCQEVWVGKLLKILRAEAAE